MPSTDLRLLLDEDGTLTISTDFGGELTLLAAEQFRALQMLLRAVNWRRTWNVRGNHSALFYDLVERKEEARDE